MEVLVSATAQLSKLAELRAKTDRELVRIIGNALDVALLLANTQVDSAGLLHGRAREIYADTLMLLPKVKDVGERRRLERLGRVLRERLEQRQESRSCDVGTTVWA
jgi:hypothetical protein